MPADWNGRFMFQGGGGLNGAIREPIGSQATGERSALERGFAVVAIEHRRHAVAGADEFGKRRLEQAVQFTVEVDDWRRRHER